MFVIVFNRYISYEGYSRVGDVLGAWSDESVAKLVLSMIVSRQKAINETRYKAEYNPDWIWLKEQFPHVFRSENEWEDYPQLTINDMAEAEFELKSVVVDPRVMI